MPRRSASAATAASRSPWFAFATILTLGVIATTATGCGRQAEAAGRIASPRTPAGAARASAHARPTRPEAALVLAQSPAAVAHAAAAKQHTPAAPTPPDRPALRTNWQAGVNLTADLTGDFLAPGSDAALRAAKADGSTSVEIVATWYMPGATASAVAADAARTPSDAAVMHAVANAQSLGLQVLLKPQVDVLDGTYRGLISPTNRAAWFASYQTMLVHYATLARQLRVGGLVVGVELGSMVSGPRDTTLWRNMIATVRRLGYKGSLTYAANWDQLHLVGFWRSLDYIGIDAYFPLVPQRHQSAPTIADLVSAWHGSYVAGGPFDWVDEVAQLEHAQHRPVVFTELGYVATACTAAAPYALVPICPTAADPTVPSQRAQQDAYVAALRVWSRVPFVRGIYWWDWPTDDNQTTDVYSPRGKPAERTIAEWDAARGDLVARR